MNRYTIEKRDREVVEKFRSVVSAKVHRKKTARRRIFGVLSLVVCSGLFFFYNHVARPPAPDVVMNRSDVIALEKAGDRKASLLAEADIQTRVSAENQPTAIQEDSRPLPPNPGNSALEASVTEKEMSQESVPVLAPRVKTSGKKGLSEISNPLHRDTEMRIAEIVTCRGVKNKMAVSPQNAFSLQNGANPYVWMDVRSKEIPYKLRHVYYHNDRRYCVVPLEIRYPRMRTWSNVTLRYAHEVGQWRVDVVTEKGEIISRVDFTVTP